MKKIIYLSFAALFFLSSETKAQFLFRGTASVITPQCNAGVTTYQLAAALPTQDGSIWNTTPINLTQQFDIEFQIFLGNQPYNVGADGMCFVFQTNSTDSGAGGGGLGYQGITPSLAAEFDTYQNGWDPGYCHTAIEKNGDIDHTDLSGNNLAGPVQLSPINATLPDGAWHNVEITWDPAKDSMRVYFDCNLRVGYKGNVIDSIFGGNPVVYWGFTGGTGADDNKEAVCITNSYTLTDSIVSPTCAHNDGKAIINVHNGNAPLTYLWTPSGQTTATATGLSAGLYTVTIHAAYDTCVMLRDTIRLTGSTVSVSSTDAKCSVLNSGTATINIVNGTSPYTYLWSNGETNKTDTSLVSGKYYVTVTDNSGCHFLDSVTVVTNPAPTISTTPPSNDSVCFKGGTVISGTGGVTYTWLPATGLSCTNCASPTASPTVTTVYTVTGTDINGCTNTATLRVKVIPLPQPIITGRDTICIGSSTTLYSSGGTTYLWNPGAGTGTTYIARPPLTTTYTVKATTDGCSKDTTVKVTVVPIPRAVIKASKDSVCLGDTLTLSASGGITYRWSPGNSTNVSIHPNLLNQTTYTLYAYGGTCEDSTTQTIKVIQPVTASVSYSRDTICPYDTATITVIASGGTLNYQWNNGQTTSTIHVKDSVTTTHTVTVTGTCGSKQETVTIYVIPLPKLTIGGSRFECQGGQDTLTVSSSTNPTSYRWSTGKTGTSITPTINGDAVYTVVATNSLGCSVTDTISVKEASNPLVSLTYPEACGVGNYVTITADTAGGTGPYTYSWSSGGTEDTTMVYIENSGTIFTLKVTNEYGCTATAMATVVIDTPRLYACCSTTILLGGDTEIIASGLGITQLQWSPANSGLSCYTCPNPTATPTVTTTYTVSGVDSADCPVERTVTITVETPCYNFIVPNVITPTNAGPLGLDNILYIPTHGFTSWSLLIFDRWGHEVFKSTDPNKYWDGNNESGASAAAGVYYYIINASCVGNTFKKDGFIQLIR